MDDALGGSFHRVVVFLCTMSFYPHESQQELDLETFQLIRHA